MRLQVVLGRGEDDGGFPVRGVVRGEEGEEDEEGGGEGGGAWVREGVQERGEGEEGCGGGGGEGEG